MIKLTKHSENQYSANLQNGRFIGYFERDVDGYFYWWPDLKEVDGCWGVNLILELAEKLKEVNKPYEQELDRHFSEVKE